MFIRPSIDLLKLQSEGTPVTAARRDWVIDWRWLASPQDDENAFASERSLIDCAPWAKPKKPRRA